ncbi:MAG TPA: VTT domain-containing protein [Gemmatimonadota bacterium]|nr:VTT domain-containing protein [Gemmatimonadota bacterium]
MALFLLLAFGLPSPEELGPLLFFLVILTEVIIAPIPGGVIAFVGAAQLGFWTAWPILYAGNVIGSNVLFHLARRFGRPFVERHTKEKQRVKYERAIERHPRLLWIPYALPVFPIDVISALLGVSAMRRRWFLLTTVLALPSYTGITALVGARYGHYIPWLNWISAAILVLLGVYLFVFVLPSLVRRGRRSGRANPDGD